MKYNSTRFPLLSILIVFGVSIVVLLLMSIVPWGLFRHEIIITAIICLTCICGISIICSLIYAIHANNGDNADKTPPPEEIELLKEIKAAFSKEPNRVNCHCQKVLNSTVEVKVRRR